MQNYNISVRTTEYGISFGAALAIVISYTQHKSVLWAILHGILSWIYVVYHVVVTL